MLQLPGLQGDTANWLTDMYSLHCTRKLLDRLKVEVCMEPPTSTTVLGGWYATVLLWKPQVALLVNETTLLPVLMPLAPAQDLAKRFPGQLASVLAGYGVPRAFIEQECGQMGDAQYAKAVNRSVVGIMNQFTYLAAGYREYLETDDLLALSHRLAETPCGPLYKTTISPDRALKALVDRSTI